MYKFEKSGNGVKFTRPGGAKMLIRDSVLIDQSGSEIILEVSKKYSYTFGVDEVESIGGSAPAGTVSGVFDQLSALFEFTGSGSSSVPMYSDSAFIQVNTAAAGANFAAFPDTPCDALQVENNSGFDIEVKKGASTAYIRIPSYTGGRYFSGISNANQLSIRRVDLSNTQINIKAEAITV